MPANEWRLEAYKQGSDACRNYSGLTMRIRTLAQQILAVSVVGFAAAMSEAVNITNLDMLFGVGGVTLLILTTSLTLVDWHYKTAFTAIRDSLAELEQQEGLYGPWQAHLETRTRFKDHIASAMPFLFLGIAGVAAIGWGWLHAMIWDWQVLLPIALLTALFAFFSAQASRQDRRKHDQLAVRREA